MERVFASFHINLRFQKHQRSVRASPFLWRSQTTFFWFNEISSLNCRSLVFLWKSFTNNIMPKEKKKKKKRENFLTFKPKRCRPEVQFYTCSVQNWVIIPYFPRQYKVTSCTWNSKPSLWNASLVFQERLLEQKQQQEGRSLLGLCVWPLTHQCYRTSCRLHH